MLLTIPWATTAQEDLGAAYNRAVIAASNHRYVGLLDYDAMLTTPHWAPCIHEAFAAHAKTVGVFGAMTNRIGNRAQHPPGHPESHDIREHRAFGEALWQEHGSTVLDITDNDDLLGGVLMITTHEVWRRVGGFPSKPGKLGVDNEYHRRVREAGLRVLILRGLYVYHWYRA